MGKIEVNTMLQVTEKLNDLQVRNLPFRILNPLVILPNAKSRAFNTGDQGDGQNSVCRESYG